MASSVLLAYVFILGLLHFPAGYLQVANATHAHWTWKETAATSTATGELVAVDSAAAWTDDAWVVQAAV